MVTAGIIKIDAEKLTRTANFLTVFLDTICQTITIAIGLHYLMVRLRGGGCGRLVTIVSMPPPSMLLVMSTWIATMWVLLLAVFAPLCG